MNTGLFDIDRIKAAEVWQQPLKVLKRFFFSKYFHILLKVNSVIMDNTQYAKHFHVIHSHKGTLIGLSLTDQRSLIRKILPLGRTQLFVAWIKNFLHLTFNYSNNYFKFCSYSCTASHDEFSTQIILFRKVVIFYFLSLPACKLYSNVMT